MKTFKKAMLLIMILTGTNSMFALQVNKNKNGVANQGYDVVNYFTTNTAERGSKDYATKHNDATYYFVSAENLKIFKVNPNNYVPQFDGYCAFAVAKMNQKVSVDPKTFRIDDGNLYLFYNDFWEGKPFNTIVPWLNNELEMEKLATTNWKTLK